MRKNKLLLLLALLMTAATGAWAQRLYLEVDGTAATLKYSANEADYSDKPYFIGTMWQQASGFKSSVETITVDATCENFAGEQLQGLFAACSKLTSITGLGTINTTNVTTMQNMFGNCGALETVDLSGFNTANVTTMRQMFNNCSSLKTLDLSGFNTANVTTMQNMFASCSSLETVDLSSFNTASVTTMNSMFFECSKLETIFVGDDWSTASTNSYMFTNCTSLPNWDGTTDGTKAYYGGDGKGYLTYKVDEPAGPTSYTVSLKDGVKDADKWTVKVGEGEAQALPIGGLKGDGSETVTLKYNGRLKVKGVKATSDAAPAGKPVATLIAAPKPWDEYYVGDELLETLGTAEGGTLMYKLTTTNVKPTSTEGFSTENPKGVENAPSYKNYIWYYIKGDDTHSDSEIFGPIELDVWDS